MEKLTKHQFEEKLYRLNKNKLLDYDTLRENGSLLHLYYNDEGHIGTWQRGGHYHIFHNNLPYTDGDAVWHTTGYSDEMLLNKMNEWEAMTGKQHPRRDEILANSQKENV